MNSTDASVARDDRGHDGTPQGVLSCIVGPTAAGKSALAMALAQARRLAIVSADSRQVYRGFDVGTAKPTMTERAAVRHYGVDVCDPQERYSAHRWAIEAAQWIEDATAAGTQPVVVGGTGLYIRALVQPLNAVPVADRDRRAALEPWLATLDRESLVRWCTVLDPSRAHLGRTQLLRAVETALLEGRRISDAMQASPTIDRPARYLVVDPGPVLAERIAARVQHMVSEGFVEEVRELRQLVPGDAPAWNASGYGVMREHVEGRLPLDAAMERVKIETRQYAKRQRTWFRHQLPAHAVTHINPLAPDALDVALAWWDQRDNATGTPDRARYGASHGVQA
jgi:tRNA dimethylallyltransferase